MTAEERAAVAWLENLPADEHLNIFRPPAGESTELFTLKDDHETPRDRRCRRCSPFGVHEPPVVIE